MLEELLAHLRNWFAAEIREDTFTVTEGAITLPFLPAGRYFRVVGSAYNDGVYQSPVSGLTDETFTGAIWVLSIPPAVIALSEEIGAWVVDNPATAITSESFGGYSYSKATGASGQPATWQDVFRVRLNRWRKI